MSSNLKVNTILPSTGTTIGIGTVGGLINVVGNIDVNSTSGISTFNGLEISGIVTAKAGAAVTYYGDGSNLTGISAGAGGDTGLDLNDNVKIRLGTGNDCELYHSGNNTFITNTTGFTALKSSNGILYLSGNSTHIRSGDDGETQAVFNDNGAVELYFDNSKKFETTSYGALVTGTISAGSGNFDVTDNGKFKAGNSSDLQFFHNGTNSVIQNNTGTLVLQSDTFNLNNSAGTESLINATANGAVELYYDNVKKFETNSDGVLVTRNSSDTTMSNTSQLVLRNTNNGGNTLAGIRFEVSSNTASDHFIVQKKHSGGSGTDLIVGHGSNERIRFVESGGITFHGDTAAANALDDYEEGSWTPAVNVGSVSVADGGTYVKIGKHVHLTVLLYNFSNTSSSSSILISGIPFNSSAQAVGTVWLRRTNSGDKGWVCTIGDSANNIINIMRHSNGNDMGQALSYDAFAHSTPYMNITLTYQTNS